MAELADALRSGRSEGSLMWVQVPPSAPQGAAGKAVRKRLAERRAFLLRSWRLNLQKIDTKFSSNGHLEKVSRPRSAQGRVGQWYNKGKSGISFIS